MEQQLDSELTLSLDRVCVVLVVRCCVCAVGASVMGDRKQNRGDEKA